ncbi:MAG: SDR family oxidoreductase [Anaerolineae bacterium]|nr:SDR family oxidoreductase [Gloeobacterales cyanobacterium ES-bin-313]
MRAFVTGGTGLLGSNLVRQLVEAGYAVRALVRDRQKAEQQFVGLSVEVVKGDMTDVDGFADALAGCDVLFHAAAYFREYSQPGDHWTTLQKINVEGTVRLLEHAEKQGVSKAIYVSSSGVIGPRTDGGMADESCPPGKLSYENLYFRSKVEAEKAVACFLETHRMPVVHILPGWMFGPGDAAPTDSGQIILDFLNGKLPGVLELPGRVSIVDARDVAAAMIQAVERGVSGERYIVSGQSYSFAEVVQLLAKASGLPVPVLRIPYRVGMAMAWMIENFARLTDSRALMTTNGLRTLANDIFLSSARAESVLGFQARPFPETLRDEVVWFRSKKRAPTASQK